MRKMDFEEEGEKREERREEKREGEAKPIPQDDLMLDSPDNQSLSFFLSLWNPSLFSFSLSFLKFSLFINLSFPFFLFSPFRRLPPRFRNRFPPTPERNHLLLSPPILFSSLFDIKTTKSAHNF